MFRKEIFGARIAERLEALSMNQTQLARSLDCDHSTIVKLVNGTRGPSLEFLDALATALKTSVDYLMGRTDDRRLHKLPKENDKE